MPSKGDAHLRVELTSGWPANAQTQVHFQVLRARSSEARHAFKIRCTNEGSLDEDMDIGIKDVRPNHTESVKLLMKMWLEKRLALGLRELSKRGRATHRELDL